ncbi:hypothetical protein [Alkalicaulis satelles]|nr:hypothetical protein [Alkalicaulis satelles]
MDQQDAPALTALARPGAEPDFTNPLTRLMAGLMGLILQRVKKQAPAD